MTILMYDINRIIKDINEPNRMILQSSTFIKKKIFCKIKTKSKTLEILNKNKLKKKKYVVPNYR